MEASRAKRSLRALVLELLGAAALTVVGILHETQNQSSGHQPFKGSLFKEAVEKVLSRRC